MDQLTDVDTNCWVLLFKLFPKHPNILSRTKNEVRQIDFLEDADGIRENRAASIVEHGRFRVVWAQCPLMQHLMQILGFGKHSLGSGQATQSQLTLQEDSCPGVRWLSGQALAVATCQTIG